MEKKEEVKDVEEVCETFEVEEKGKEPTEVKSCVEVEKKHSETDETKRYGKILRNILIVLGIVVIGFFLWLMFLDSLQTTNYKGLEFKVVQEGNIIFYNYAIPLEKNGTVYANYNFYLRRNPPKTGQIPFEGTLNFKDIVVMNVTNELSCDGDGIISIVNMEKPFTLMGATVLNDPNATCDDQDRYMLISVVKGEENKIVQTGQSCYVLTVKDCDVLDVTERFMLETFVRMKEKFDL